MNYKYENRSYVIQKGCYQDDKFFKEQIDLRQATELLNALKYSGRLIE